MIINPSAGVGKEGKSAYQYAVDGGYPGTEEEFQALMGTGPWLPQSGGTMAGQIKSSADTPLIATRANKAAISADIIGQTATPTIYSDGFGFASKRGQIAGSVLQGILAPTYATDAANKEYVDTAVAGAGGFPSVQEVVPVNWDGPGENDFSYNTTVKYKGVYIVLYGIQPTSVFLNNGGSALVLVRKDEYYLNTTFSYHENRIFAPRLTQSTGYINLWMTFYN